MLRRSFLTAVAASLAHGLAHAAERATGGRIDNGPAPPAEPRMQTAVKFRQPIGHTHTCSAGHTWDHTENPSHTCQICGRTQFYWDQPAKMVPVRGPVKAAAEPEASVERTFSLPASGCANGNCPTGGSIRTGRIGLLKRLRE